MLHYKHGLQTDASTCHVISATRQFCCAVAQLLLLVEVDNATGNRGPAAMSGPIVRLVAQVVLVGVNIVTKAFMQAYQQAKAGAEVLVVRRHSVSWCYSCL